MAVGQYVELRLGFWHGITPNTYNPYLLILFDPIN